MAIFVLSSVDFEGRDLRMIDTLSKESNSISRRGAVLELKSETEKVRGTICKQ
jgi:hypothetical protein